LAEIPCNDRGDDQELMRVKYKKNQRCKFKI